MQTDERVTDAMIEAAARAMCKQGSFDPDERMPNDGPRWKYYVDGARAALTAADRIRRTRGVEAAATITPLYAAPVRSAIVPAQDEAERLRALLDIALEALDSYSDPTSYFDSYGDTVPADAEVHEGLHARDTAASIRSALSPRTFSSAEEQYAPLYHSREGGIADDSAIIPTGGRDDG